jgi:hypothetical protein
MQPVLRALRFRHSDEQNVRADRRSPNRHPAVIPREDAIAKHRTPERREQFRVVAVDDDVAYPAGHGQEHSFAVI